MYSSVVYSNIAWHRRFKLILSKRTITSSQSSKLWRFKRYYSLYSIKQNPKQGIVSGDRRKAVYVMNFYARYYIWIYIHSFELNLQYLKIKILAKTAKHIGLPWGF